MSCRLLLNAIGLCIAIVSCVALIEGFVAFVGRMFDFPDLCLGLMAARVMQPFVWFMGVDWVECKKVKQNKRYFVVSFN